MSLTVKSGNDLSYLFSGMNNQNAANGGASSLTSILSDYNAIRNGSYAKLAKQYYAKDSGTAKTNPLKDRFADAEGSVTNKTEKLQKDTEIKENKALISSVASFRKSVSEITNDDTLLKKASKGTETADYDYDKINSKIEGFVKNYNSVIEKGADSDSQTVLRNVLNMTNTSNSYKEQLKTAGITINDDNTLSFNKETLKNALNSTDSKNGANVVNNLFAKTSNFMQQLDKASTNVASQAASDVYSLGGYNSDGAYKQTLESIYNTTI